MLYFSIIEGVKTLAFSFENKIGLFVIKNFIQINSKLYIFEKRHIINVYEKIYFFKGGSHSKCQMN